MHGFFPFLPTSSPRRTSSFNRLLPDTQVEFFAPLAQVLRIPFSSASVSGACCARHPAATHFSNSSPKNIPRSRQFSLCLVTDTRGLAGEVSNWPKILELTQVPVTLEAGPQWVEPPCQVMAVPATAATVVATAFILDCPQGSLVLCTLGHNTQYPS